MNKVIVAGALIALIVVVGAYAIIRNTANTSPSKQANNTFANNSSTANVSTNSNATLLTIYNDTILSTSQSPLNPTAFTQMSYDNESGYFYVSGVNGVNGLLVMKNLSVVGNLNNTNGTAIYDPTDGYTYAFAHNDSSSQVAWYYLEAIKNASTVTDVVTNVTPRGFPIYDSVYGKLYFPTNSSLLIINNTKVVGSIPLAFNNSYFGIIYSTKTGYLYVDNYTNSIKVVGANGIIGTIKIPTNLMVFGISYDPGNGYVYVAVYNASMGRNGIYVIDGTTVVSNVSSIAVISNINRYIITHGFYNEVTGKMYVFADYFNSTQNANHTITLSIDDNATLQGTDHLMILENDSLYKNVTLGESDQIIAHVENKFGYVYILVRNSTGVGYNYRMIVLDKNDSISAEFPLGNYTPPYPFGTYSDWRAGGYSSMYTQYDLVYDNVTNRAYVSYMQKYPIPQGQNKIYILDNATIGSIATNSSMGYYMFYNPSNGYLYAVN